MLKSIRKRNMAIAFGYLRLRSSVEGFWVVKKLKFSLMCKLSGVL